MIYTTLLYDSDAVCSFSVYHLKSSLDVFDFKKLLEKIVARKDEIMDDDIHLDVWDAYEMAFDEFDIKRIDNFTDEIIAIDVSSDIVF